MPINRWDVLMQKRVSMLMSKVLLTNPGVVSIAEPNKYNQNSITTIFPHIVTKCRKIPILILRNIVFELRIGKNSKP